MDPFVPFEAVSRRCAATADVGFPSHPGRSGLFDGAAFAGFGVAVYKRPL